MTGAVDKIAAAPVVCANPPCRTHFEPNRPHQRFCSSTCRRESWAVKRKEGRENAGERVLRRPTRDGYGARVYLTARELGFLAGLLGSLDLMDTEGHAASIKAKAHRGMDRSRERMLRRVKSRNAERPRTR